MNRTLRRPMFRMGGSTNEGITSGLDTPKRGLVDGPGKYSQPDNQCIKIRLQHFSNVSYNSRNGMKLESITNHTLKDLKVKDCQDF